MGIWWKDAFQWNLKYIQRLKVMEGNLVLECNNCTHLRSEVRTQFTNDHDSEVVLKDLDFWEGQTKDLDGSNESNLMKTYNDKLTVWVSAYDSYLYINYYAFYGQIQDPLY